MACSDCSPLAKPWPTPRRQVGLRSSGPRFDVLGPTVRVLLLTDAQDGAVVPALSELEHDIVHVPLDQRTSLTAHEPDVVMLDGTGDLGKAVATCRSESVQALDRPLLVVVTFGALAAVKITWGFDDWLLPEISTVELRTRLRLATERLRLQPASARSTAVLRIDSDGYRAHLHGKPLELTYTEFELLRALLARPGHVWTRAALLREVWGYDHHVAGTRTVDVHVTRLRAKLAPGPGSGVEIQTVRNVGYRLVVGGG